MSDHLPGLQLCLCCAEKIAHEEIISLAYYAIDIPA